MKKRMIAWLLDIDRGTGDAAGGCGRECTADTGRKQF